MDFKELIKMAMDEKMEHLHAALDGLTLEERRFQPSPESNHIDFTVWHMARVEDHWVQGFARRTHDIWKHEEQLTKQGLPKGVRDRNGITRLTVDADGNAIVTDVNGYGYTAKQIASFPQFEFDDLMAYYDRVYRATIKYLNSLTVEDLDTCPNPKWRPGYDTRVYPFFSIGKMFTYLIVEGCQHLGHVAYLRGLQRGLGK